MGLDIKFSFDDGCKEDIRIAELLKKYGFVGTFYIPSNCKLTTVEIQKLDSLGMEVGGHT